MNFFLMSKLTFEQIETQLYIKIPKYIVDDIYIFSNKKNIILWGEQKPRYFLFKMIVLAFYKDTFRIGYKKLISQINLHFKISHHSFNENTQRLRKIFKKWAETKIILGDSVSWNYAVRNCNFKGIIKDANLWIDSTDFPIIGYKGLSKKDESWSYKLNHSGRRYMMLRNGKGKILKIWGGYSPKVFDGTWLEIMKEELEKNLNGGVILGDNHFSLGNYIFKSVKFLTNISRKKGRKRKKGNGCSSEDTDTPLSKKQSEYNENHRIARARVETPFALIKTKIESLNVPFQEGEIQLDYLVFLAAGIHNMII